MHPHGRGPILLSRYLALAWLGLVAYASLHPFAGWRDTGVSPLAFLEGGWPRYWTVFDLVANVAVYLPLGFFLTLALSRLPGRFTALVLALARIAGGERDFTRLWRKTRRNLDTELSQAAIACRRRLRRGRLTPAEGLAALDAFVESLAGGDLPGAGLHLRRALELLPADRLDGALPAVLQGCRDVLSCDSPALSECLVLSVHVLREAIDRLRA